MGHGMQKTLIFTDVDGTLLDPVSYSFREALPALDVIQQRGIPLILCSSKTRAELETYRHSLNNHHPFISENGGGIFIPLGYFSIPVAARLSDGYQVITLGMPYAEIKYRFARIRKRLPVPVRGFADMSAEEVARLTGLSPAVASLAKQREFDEAFVFEGEPVERFLRAIESEGMHWTRGRLFHVMGDHDKGRAVSILKSLYERQYGPVVSIGLGDAMNDVPMLQSVDRPVLVMRMDGSFDSRMSFSEMQKTQRPGPPGWSDAVLQLLATNDAKTGTSRRIRWQDELVGIFNAALAAADPHEAVLASLRIENNCLHVGGAAYDLAAYDRIVVVGAGKASARMALAIEELLGARISAGMVVVKHGHAAALRRIAQVEASHPLPDEAGVEGTRRLLEMARAADEKTLVICLLSGGASALLAAPVNGVTLEDKQQLTGMLLRAGATIGELNAVRKHLSLAKGGRLAQEAYPAQVLTLLLSDVIGDRLDVIASGPTAPDKTTFADAWSVLEKYRLQQSVPACVREHLQRGMSGLEAETMKSGDSCLATVRNEIIGGIGMALAAAERQARQLGFSAEIVSTELQGEARAAASMLAQRAKASHAALQPAGRCCLLCGGETTVTVTGNGRGGRNQELALAFALEIEGLAGVSMLSAGTDGTDGPTDAAGAMVDGETAARARGLDIEPERYLQDNDSYSFFQRFDALAGAHSHLVTGPTGTNVMDIQIVLCDKDDAHER